MNLIMSDPVLLVHRGAFRDKAMRQKRTPAEETTAGLHANGKAEIPVLTSVGLETNGSLNVLEAA
ncbi:YetF domain-containing protein [Hoeflea sp.]|uniref:YetF domain-containing protein n=1 Tax=Hoeflea sp. TaxID=1940281 RepID=UPI003A936D8D